MRKDRKWHHQNSFNDKIFIYNPTRMSMFSMCIRTGTIGRCRDRRQTCRRPLGFASFLQPLLRIWCPRHVWSCGDCVWGWLMACWGGRWLVYDIGSEKVKVQLTLSVCVEGEPAYLTLHVPVFGSVPIILGTGGSKLDDVVPRFQCDGEFAEIITRGWKINSEWPPVCNSSCPISLWRSDTTWSQQLR